MPAAAIVLPFAATIGLEAVGITAAGIGAAVTGLSATTLTASVVGGAIIGTGTGALSAAIQGGDILKGALGGAVSGGVGAGVTGGLTSALGGGPLPQGMYGPPSPAMLGGSAALGEATAKGLGSFAGGLSGSLAAGVPFDQALRSGLISGTGSALSSGLQYGLGLDRTTSSAIGNLGKTALGVATAPKLEYPQFKAPESPIRDRRPSASLGQSLSIAPSLGYSPGMTVFGSGGEGDKPKRNVWNVSSLRNVGESEA